MIRPKLGSETSRSRKSGFAIILATLGGAWVVLFVVLVVLFAGAGLPPTAVSDDTFAIGIVARGFGFTTLGVIGALAGSGLRSLKKP